MIVYIAVALAACAVIWLVARKWQSPPWFTLAVAAVLVALYVYEIATGNLWATRLHSQVMPLVVGIVIAVTVLRFTGPRP